MDGCCSPDCRFWGWLLLRCHGFAPLAGNGNSAAAPPVGSVLFPLQQHSSAKRGRRTPRPCDVGSERRAGRAAVASARRRRGNSDHLICSVEFFFLKQIKQDETASEPQVRETMVVINESSGSLAPGAPDRSSFLFDPLIFRVFAIYIKQKMSRNAYFFCSPP